MDLKDCTSCMQCIAYRLKNKCHEVRPDKSLISLIKGMEE